MKAGYAVNVLNIYPSALEKRLWNVRWHTLLYEIKVTISFNFKTMDIIYADMQQ